MTWDGSSSFRECLAKVLPAACRFTIHHLSTPPTQSRPLYAATPGQLAEETYCESHFLSISVISDGLPLQVFAIEVLIYSTAFLTTLFVSKADSTGYLNLLNLAPGTPSPLRLISTTFLEHLIRARKRSDKRLVLSLFARAQNQYLFAGSIENSNKHVLDDRGLIKWWCKVVDPILVSHKSDSQARGPESEESDVRSLGYLRVPGCDKYETQTFLPKDERGRKQDDRRWRTSDPLREFGKSPDLPERCLIPRFPDDPKARFVEQLDDELPDEGPESSQTPSQLHAQEAEIPPKKQNTGRWRSVTSLEQFWEMMSFRQECSSGRLVGFLWAKFQPAYLVGEEGQFHDAPQVALPTPEISQNQDPVTLPPQSPLRSSPVPEVPSTPVKGTPPPSQQTPAPTPHKVKEADIRSQPEETKYYYWPTSSRGEVILRQKDYQRASNILLHLDYANQELALDSTRKWINDIAERAGSKIWGQEVVGTVPLADKADAERIEANATILNAGLIRKKKRPFDESIGQAETASGGNENGVNTLSTGLIRKKAKIINPNDIIQDKLQNNGSLAPD